MILSDISLKRPVAMTVLIIAMVVLGLYAFIGLNTEFIPQVDIPTVTIVTTYPGAGPEEVETQVTKIIEDAVSEVNGIDTIQSMSMENVSQVFIKFKMEVDVDFVAIDVREKIDAILVDLPADADPPLLMKIDVNAMPVAHLALTGKRSARELYRLADERVIDLLNKIPGVASAELTGGQVREIQVLIDQDALSSHGLSLLGVTNALATDNLNMPSGHIVEGRREYSIRLEGEFESLDEIRALDLVTPGGDVVPLSAVARVEDASVEPREMALFEGEECVAIVLRKQGDANTVEIVDALKRELDGINRLLPDDVNLVIAQESSGFIRASNEDVSMTMIIGILLTGAILFLFLHDLKQTFIAALSMPISVVTTFLLFLLAGFSLNIISMMALAISVGILVTNSIVVIENIHRHVQTGISVREASRKGTSEIFVAVFGSAMTNIVVFLPIAFMSGLVGKFFYQFGMTIVFATLVSLFVSFTLIPLISARIMRPKAEEERVRGWSARFGRIFDAGFDALARAYTGSVAWVLRHRAVVIAVAVVLFAISIWMGRFLGSEMIATPDQAEIIVNMELAPGMSLEESRLAFEKLRGRLDTALGSLDEHSLITIGEISGVATSEAGVHLGSMLFKVKDKGARPEGIETIIAMIRMAVMDVPGAAISVLQPSPIGGSMADIQLEINGPSNEMLARFVPAISAAIAEIPGTRDIQSSWKEGKPQINLIPDRRRLKDHGLSLSQVAMTLRGAVHGLVSGKYRENDEEYDIRVMLAETDRQDTGMLGGLEIPTPVGTTVPISQVAVAQETSGATSIYRFNKQKAIEITLNVAGRSVGEVVAEIESAIASLDLPPEITHEFTGMVQMMGESFQQLGIALVLAIILTYLLLAAILESFIQPLAIIATVPLAIIGVIFALLLANQALSIFSLLAVVMLVGIVVNNGILIIEYVHSLRVAGMGRTEAVLEACRIKLRPIMMTTIATIIGMLPMAIGSGIGSELRVPMGITAIGGLAVSAVMAVFVIPVLYTLLDDLARRFGRRH